MARGMGHKPNNLEDDQLYKLFAKYTNRVDNSDDRAIIIGYSVLNALFHYHNKSNSEEEKLFEEVKSVYENLKNNLEILLEDDPIKVIFDLKFDVDTQLQKQTNLTSQILTNFLPVLKRKNNHIEYLRKIGTNLYTKVNDKGPFTGNKNILLNDFETLKETYS